MSTSKPPKRTGSPTLLTPGVYPEASPQLKRKKRKSTATEGGEPEEPEPEKRQAMFKKACPKTIQERVDRVRAQRFFCVARNKLSDLKEEFKVLGSTGNVYTVTIQHVPNCSCPDGSKGNHCKHILFVHLKILKIPATSNLYYQKALLTSELTSIFANAPSAPTDKRLESLYRVATGQAEPEASGSGGGGGVGKRLPEEGDSCPVCYEDFDPAQGETGLVFCLSLQGCGKPIHGECLNEWAKQAKPVTCVFCRAEWVNPPVAGAGAAGPSYSAEGYLNLGGSLGISQHRDTSSYYQGPQKGKGWGYRSYY